MRKYVVRTQKGGVGKTTLVVHGAWRDAEVAKQSVVVCDFDSQGNASKTLERYRAQGITASRLFDPTPLPLITPAQPAESGESIVLIAADKKLDNFSQADAKVIVPALVQNLRELAKTFGRCWIDTGPSNSIVGVAALIAADAVISPLDLEQYAVDGVESTLQTIAGVQQRFNKNLQFLGLLPSRVDGHSKSHQTTLAELVKKYGKVVLETSIKETEAIAAVPRVKVPVWRIGTSAAREHGRALLKTLAIIEGSVK
jgi:chromosome partitioning protein